MVVNLGGSSRKYQLREWETEKTSNKGCVIKQVTTIHNLNLSLLGHSGRQCRTHSPDLGDLRWGKGNPTSYQLRAVPKGGRY